MADRLRRYRGIPPDRSPTKPCPNPKCSNLLYLTDHECRRCGTVIPKQDRTPDNTPCPHCWEFIPADSQVCPKCGFPVYHPLPPEKESPPQTVEEKLLATLDKRPATLPDKQPIPTIPIEKAPSRPKQTAPTKEKTTAPHYPPPSPFPLPYAPTSTPSKHTITWIDAFKISVAIAVAPFVQQFLSYTVETAQNPATWLWLQQLACQLQWATNCR